jgi:hypothetical protein
MATARVYSFLDGSKKHDQDLRTCPKCGGSKYTDALKVYNKGKPAWCMPHKGTESHAEVLRIMNAPKKPTRKLRKAPVMESVVVPVGKKRVSKPIDPEIRALMNKPKTKQGPSKETVSELESVFNGSSLSFKLRASGAYFITMKDGQGKIVMKDGEPGFQEAEYTIYSIQNYLGKYIITVILNEDTKEVNVEVSKSMFGSIKLTDFSVKF